MMGIWLEPEEEMLLPSVLLNSGAFSPSPFCFRDKRNISPLLGISSMKNRRKASRRLTRGAGFPFRYSSLQARPRGASTGALACCGTRSTA
jgi:hypothetical protein